MFELESWPVILGFIIIIAILIPCISVYRVYSRYRQVAKALPTPRAIQQTQPGALDQKRDLLATGLLDSWKTLPEHEVEITRHALWTAMLLVTVSDGSIDPRELRFVADLFGKMAGGTLESEPVMDAAMRARDGKVSAMKEISKARAVSNASKEYILAGAFLVSVSDHALAESETDCLGDIADALALDQRQRKAIFKGITKRLGV